MAGATIGPHHISTPSCLPPRSRPSHSIVSLSSPHHIAVSWSPDSEYLLTVLDGRGFVQIYSVSDAKWTASIDEAAAGVVDAMWLPDSRHVITCSEFRVRLSVFSLEQYGQLVCYIASPKLTASQLSIHPDGSLLAVAHRKGGQDLVALYETSGDFQQVTFNGNATREREGEKREEKRREEKRREEKGEKEKRRGEKKREEKK